MLKGAKTGGCSSLTQMTWAPPCLPKDRRLNWISISGSFWETERKIKCLRSDGGKEYFYGQFNSYLQKKGIRRELNYRYTLEHNNVAERKNRSIVDTARAMLEEKNMPKFYWAEAIRTVVYIQNRIRDKVSAHELYFGRKLKLRHLRIFGSIAYVHVPDEKQTKLDPKSEKCILVNYSHE